MLQLDRQTRKNLGILAWVALGLFLIYLGINLAIWIVVNLLPTLFCLVVVVIVVYLMFANTFKTAKPAVRPPSTGDTSTRRNGLANEQNRRHKGKGNYQFKSAVSPTDRTPFTPTHRAPARPTSRGTWRG